jgi:hypothetical protein
MIDTAAWLRCHPAEADRHAATRWRCSASARCPRHWLVHRRCGSGSANAQPLSSRDLMHTKRGKKRFAFRRRRFISRRKRFRTPRKRFIFPINRFSPRRARSPIGRISTSFQQFRSEPPGRPPADSLRGRGESRPFRQSPVYSAAIPGDRRFSAPELGNSLGPPGPPGCRQGRRPRVRIRSRAAPKVLRRRRQSRSCARGNPPLAKICETLL